MVGGAGKKDHPALPIGPEELAATAAACLEAGAAMIHVHVRDRDGGHLLDADAYREATNAIRDAVGDRLVIQITSEAVGRYKPAEQMAVVRATRARRRCRWRCANWCRTTAHETAFADFLLWLKNERIAPQIILYAPEEASALARHAAARANPLRRHPGALCARPLHRGTGIAAGRPLAISHA